jgi:hypothetical protein
MLDDASSSPRRSDLTEIKIVTGIFKVYRQIKRSDACQTQSTQLFAGRNLISNFFGVERNRNTKFYRVLIFKYFLKVPTLKVGVSRRRLVTKSDRKWP